MPHVKDVLNQFGTRYRRALLAKTGVLAVLSLGVAAALSWKLYALKSASWWSVGVPSAIALLAVAGLLWWCRRRWIGRQQTAVHLDRALRLQERLVTAEEFAGAATPPTLYPALVQDTQRLLAAGKLPGLPRAFNRTATVLTVVLLLLLLWPVAGQHKMQLAQVPSGHGPGPTPPQPTPQGSAPDEQQRGASSQAPSSAQQSNQPSSSGAQSGERGQQSTGGSDRQSPGGKEGSTGPEDQDSPATGGASNQGTRDRSQQRGDEEQVRGGEADRADTRGSEREGQSSQSGEARRRSEHSDSSGEQESSRKAAERQTPNASRSSSGTKGSGEGAGTQGDVSQATQESSTRWEQQGGGGGIGNQEALKADIQQLLKELSGELEQLQAQLVAADSQAPQAGTHTDPELYGVPSIPEPQRGVGVPIQLGTDAEAVKGKRQGSGVGKASGEVSQAAPQATGEVAQLSEQSMEVVPVSRQPVPPEYRGVFERLYERKTTTNER